jgi:GH24 family phage-related lysozyme (muramidase)
MAAITPTENTGLIVDEFIRYAQNHLTTVKGLIDTNSIYQVGPATIIQPGKIFWTGYTVTPALPSQQFTQDDFPKNDETDNMFSVPLEQEEGFFGVSEGQVDEEIQNAEDDGVKVIGTDDAFTIGTFNQGKPFVTGFKGAGAGGFSSGFSGAVTVNLGALNLGAPWPQLSAQFIGKNEGFTQNASWDVNAYRLGFGTDRIIGADGNIRKVAAGDTTTVDSALKMLQYEVVNAYKARLVGNASYQIPEATFNALNDRQKAALISYVYNVGSLSKKPEIATAIKNGNYAQAAQLIKSGPITGGGTVYPGLIRRRAEEATLFSS